jgi:anti-anti-sigma factor
MSLKVEEDGPLLVIRPLGELDLSTAPMLDAELQKAMKDGGSEVILDLSAVTFIDSTGVRLLVIAASRWRHTGKRLRMLRGSAPVERVLKLSGLHRSLPFID